MNLAVHLLGLPRLQRVAGSEYRFRSRKSWALLAYLLLSEHPPSRQRLASLLFAEANDPIRALRWNLSEIRRGLGEDGSIDGDPVVLQLSDEVVVDVDVVTRGSWADAIDLPGLGADLLEGISIRNAAGFEAWLLSEQLHVAAASEAILHEAALASRSRGEMAKAVEYALRATSMAPLDENHQALLIGLYRLAGQDAAAEKQFHACAELLDRELGLIPGPAVEMARRQSRRAGGQTATVSSIEAIVEAGSAAVSAGAVAAGVESLRTAVQLADDVGETSLRSRARLVLAEALIHSLRGLDEEGSALLHEADGIAMAHDDFDTVAHARSELGYVDFLRARYDRAEVWFTDAASFAGDSKRIIAKATTYLGAVESDRSNYLGAVDLLERGIELSQAAGDQRQEVYGRSMLGRASLLCGDLDGAAEQLEISLELAERDTWLAFRPWPQALLGGVLLERSDTEGAARLLETAFARACQLGDPCWEGIAARGLALVADSRGDTEQALEILVDARLRCNRLADPYVWLDAYILDAQCEIGLKHGHLDTARWIGVMRELTSRTGMKELTVRALLHGAALGNPGDAAAAALLAEGIENPLLVELVHQHQ